MSYYRPISSTTSNPCTKINRLQMWNAIENSVVATATAAAATSSSSAASDPTAVLHSHLVSALSTFGDAQYWEETISPTEIRSSLSEADPSNPSSTPILLKGMKWLLANISKGRDVSDFYVVVVKLVACPVTEVRKMVYTYLVQYADHNIQTRELSLLSINSFQRGLSDSEPLIRALALRVLTSIQLQDIVPIQILAVTKHAKGDTSPYVRKCAAVAIAKLAPRCGGDDNSDQRSILLELIQYLLETDRTTMVLSSALVAFAEMTNANVTSLSMLHKCYRKLCHLLTDMDEWGQVVAITVLIRYCRVFFQQPYHYGANGSADKIDATRRVLRHQNTIDGTVSTEQQQQPITTTTSSGKRHPHHNTAATTSQVRESTAERAAAAGVTLPSRTATTSSGGRTIIKRRVVKKGFYSDEEDDSTEEEVYADTLATGSSQLATMGGGGGGDEAASNTNNNNNTNPFDAEEEDLDEDHRFSLRSAMPLLKSRNAGVVLAVCSLQYYCGVSSIPVRKAMGKALVRIGRSKHREIQYVVLTSIRKLAKECPSAFSPFLHDFFVLPDMDPPFTRMIKLDILTSLALDPPSITTVLKELRTYVQLHHTSDEYTDDDTAFVCAAVRAVGKVTEMAAIVFHRHRGDGSESSGSTRCAEAETIALNCLYGLVTFSQAADNEVIVGESVVVIQRILQMLQSSGTIVADPNRVRDRALQRILLLLVNTLSCIIECDVDEENECDDESVDDDVVKLEHVTLILPPLATASAIWLMGDYLAPLTLNGAPPFGRFDSQGRARVRMELARLLVRCFIDLDIPEKHQAVHFATKLLLSNDTSNEQEVPLCEQLLALGRLDSDLDVRDRARFESGLIHLTMGLKYDRDGMDEIPMHLQNSKPLTVDDARRIFLSVKPASSYLPLENGNGSSSDRLDRDGDGCFRFGTLSSLVGHRARAAYLPLPPWAEANSPSSLRDPPDVSKDSTTRATHGNITPGQQPGFYGSSSSDDEESSSTESSSESGSESESESDDSSSSDTDTADNENGGKGNSIGNLLPPTQRMEQNVSIRTRNSSAVPNQAAFPVNDPSDESSSSEDASDSSSEASEMTPEDLISASAAVDSLIPMGGGTASAAAMNQPSSALDDLKGLVLAPAITTATSSGDGNIYYRDSGKWMQLVRPEHSGGLVVEGRYLRGTAKSKEAQIMGLPSDKPTVVCLHIRYENQRPASGGSIRHIRILHKTSSSSASSIGPRNVIVPPEVNELPPGRKAECFLGINFANPSDRDGSLLAKFDIKFGTSGTSVDIKPSIGDLLLPCVRSTEQFDAALQRMHGFNRVETHFSLSAASRSSLPTRILSHAALTVLNNAEPVWDADSTIRWVGSLPQSLDPVYILTRCSPTGQGTLIVCCDHALVANSIMNVLKRAIAE